ncbi:hypothetical protein EV424DRAFT_916865 [Suillus variegatus]|nr:hypothetical protein EV424DRAFT_916865 [Suillus variegatus]
MKMDYEIKPKSALSYLAEELWVYVLGLLSCRDILRCTSVCKALRQTYMSSSELQYIVELSGQCLLPTSNTDDHTPIYKRLQRLKDKAHAWLNFDAYAFQTFTPPILYSESFQYGTGEHLYVWNHHNNLITISPIPSKLSQRTIERRWSPGTLCPFPRAARWKGLMVPAQNLLAARYTVGKITYIYLATLDDGCVHPHAAGPALVLELPGYYYERQAKFKCYERHIALWREFFTDEVGTSWPPDPAWQLQIWDWQHSTTLRVSLHA